MMRPLLIVVTCCVLPAIAGAQHAHASHDTGFVAMQERGRQAVGGDQYTSIHRFDAVPDGGHIELQRDRDDSVGVATIRAHLRGIANAFKAGDFSTPEMVHLQKVPGSRTMAQKRAAITYVERDLPRGSELVIRTRDAAAVIAIHRFMAFQRREHHAAGRA